MTVQDPAIDDLRAAIRALEAQRHILGDDVLELALAPLRARLSHLQKPAGLKRRQVTVLFADVVDAAAMAGGADTQDTLGRLGAALQHLSDLVVAHRGRVLRLTGEGLKAAFGMDEAREDDAERAVRAGLAMLAGAGLRAVPALHQPEAATLAVRVGAHTGDVALGAGVEADNTAMGAAVNIAARMEQSAPPGALRISQDTWLQVRGLFRVEPQPPLLVKGVEAPMRTYLVRAAVDRSAARLERGLQGLHTPMVGRQDELQRLLDTVARARQSRTLQPLTLVGDAGLGKSRLLRELEQSLRAAASGALADGPADHLLLVRSRPDSALQPWGLLRSLLAVQCGLADTDSADLARRKLVEGLAPWFAERGERQAQLIGQLSGLDFSESPHLRGLSPRSLRDQAFAAFRALVRAQADRLDGATLLLVTEDLHWADDGSLDLLQHLLDHAAELPLALVMTTRPALLSRRPGWGLPQARLVLAPLAAPHGDALARALLQRLDQLPARLLRLLVDQAEGNPYYMEELVRRLVDDGVIRVGPGDDAEADAPDTRWSLQTDRLDALRLPGTLVGLLQARLDALPAADRHAARQASIIGHVFWDEALEALDAQAPQALPALQRAAFVRRSPASDFEGTVQRQFDHHLLHQVTYGTLLKAERRLGHGVAARWLRDRTQGRGAEFLAMTGEHAERAGETALAIDCFEHAGHEAGKRFANAAAVDCYRRAIALLGESHPTRRLDLLDELEKVADTVGDRPTQDAALHEMAAILDRHPDAMRLARLRLTMALLADRRSDSRASEALAAEAYWLAEGCVAPRWAAMAQGQLAWLHLARQDYPGAARHLDIALQWAGRIEAEVIRIETESQLLTLSAMVSMETCRLDEAQVTLKAVLARGESLGLARLQLGALSSLADAAALLGRWPESMAWARQMESVAQACGALPFAGFAARALGVAAAAQGDADAAIGWLAQAEALLGDIGDLREQEIALRRLADVHCRQGAAAAGLACCVSARAVHQALDEPVAACEIEALAALCEARLGRPEAALSVVNALLHRLDSELAGRPAHACIELRWTCFQVLDALSDARAEPLLAQLAADVRARATELTAAADRDRLISALPVFREVMAAHARRAGPSLRP